MSFGDKKPFCNTKSFKVLLISISTFIPALRYDLQFYMKFGFTLFLILVWFGLAYEADAQLVKHAYRFYQNFNVAQPECGPDLQAAKALGNCSAKATAGNYIDDALPCGVNRKVYHTNLDWGIMYPNTTNTVSETYTIQMYIKITDWGLTWARIIDFSNGQSDNGIYFKTKSGSSDRCIDFYPNGISGPCPYFNTSSYYLLTFTRNGQTGIMDVYVDNNLFVSYNDSAKRYVGKPGTPIYIFRDDAAVSCESGEANFAFLSFSNQYSSNKDVTDTYNQICYKANINASADFSIDPHPSCVFPKNINIAYTGDIPAPGTGYNFNWDFDGGTVVSGSGMGPYVVNWNTKGTKKVTLTVSNIACGNKIVNTKQNLLNNLDLKATVDAGSCENNQTTVSLSANGGTSPYQYSIDSLNYQKDSTFLLGPKNYRFFVKDATNCLIAQNVKVDVKGNTLVKTIDDVAICEGQRVQLLTQSNAASFAWLPATGLDDAASKDPVASPAASSRYIVTATTNKCVTTDTIMVTVIPKVQVTVTPDGEIEPDYPYQLNAVSPQLSGKQGVTYSWTPPAGLSNASISNPFATLISDRTYDVTITSAEGCSGTGQVNLKVLPAPRIYVPTAFTPDGDGKNEVLEVVTREIKSLNYFKVYDRWGEVVFFTSEITKGWDGRFKGSEPVSGTYTYKIEGVSDKGKKIRKEGTVLLIR